MADKKSKYRSLISRLRGIASSAGDVPTAVDAIQPELNKGILINDKAIEENVFSSVKEDINKANDCLYRAIRSCSISMNRTDE